MATGLLLKIPPYGDANLRFVPAILREAGCDVEGFYLKVDVGQKAQIYLGLDRDDVMRVIKEWGALLNQDALDALPAEENRRYPCLREGKALPTITK